MKPFKMQQISLHKINYFNVLSHHLISNTSRISTSMNSNVQQACSTTSVDDRHPIATIKNVPTPASITQQGSSVTISAPRPVFLMRPTTSTSVVQGSPATTLSAKTNPRSAVKTTSGQPAVPLNRYKVSGQQSTVHHRPSSTIVSGQPSVQPNRYMPSGIQSVVDHCPSSTIVSDQPAIALNQYMASGQRRAVVHRPSSTIVSGQQAVESLTTPPRAPTKVVQQQSTKAVESGQSNRKYTQLFLLSSTATDCIPSFLLFVHREQRTGRAKSGCFEKATGQGERANRTVESC